MDRGPNHGRTLVGWRRSEVSPVTSDLDNSSGRVDRLRRREVLNHHVQSVAIGTREDSFMRKIENLEKIERFSISLNSSGNSNLKLTDQR
ncbi:hypothetical protein NMG60_11021483 [Bertholletia excelsa]